MKSRGQWFIWILALWALGGLYLRAQEPYSTPARGAGFYYGHISLTNFLGDGRDACIVRLGEGRRDPAILNMPIVPGDLITTPIGRRLEIQFDNGTIVRLDGDSELAVETVMARALSAESQLTTLTLRRGLAYVMYKQYGPKELFQVVTPESAVKMRHNSVAVIEVSESAGTEVKVREGRADMLLGQRAAALLKKSVREGGRVVVDRAGRLAPADPEPDGAFEQWNETINKDYLALHQDLTDLPEPIRRGSEALRAWARKFGLGQGRWLRDYYGAWAWQPTLLDGQGGRDWAPYQDGRWTMVGNEMFWVASEPWGWAPYHLGLWHWDAELGWLWVPGSVFSGAWVDWAGFGEYYSWRVSRVCSRHYWNRRGFELQTSIYDLYAWFRRWGYRFPNGWFSPWGIWYTEFAEWDHYDLSPQGDPSGVPGSYPMPKLIEEKALREGLLRAIRQGDQTVLRSFLFPAGEARVAARKDLLASDLAMRSVSMPEFLFSRQSWGAAKGEPSGSTGRPMTGEQAAIGARAASSVEAGLLKPSAKAGMAIGPRDWNPDAVYFAAHGATVRYQSGSNQIVCPELGVTSALAAGGFRFAGVSASETRASRGDGVTSLPDDSSSRYSGGTQTLPATSSSPAANTASTPTQKTKVEDASKGANPATVIIK